MTDTTTQEEPIVALPNGSLTNATEEPATVPEFNPAEEQRARAKACSVEVDEVLAKHRCRIVPVLEPDQVGSGPLTRMMVSTTYGVFAAE